MFNTLLKYVLGSRNDRLVKKMTKVVTQINSLEDNLKKLTPDELKNKTAEFRQRLASGTPLDDLLPEAFAVVREASRRVLNMRHFDVQLIGGMVLHEGKIAEMRTGEGKTLVATLPAYLNALTGKGVHVVTVNDYLAKRDAEWMGQLYDYLGLSTGINLSQMPHDLKQKAYAADITYGTNNEFGFDYLRDNMAFSPADRVQRGLHFAIVDEVDSILIDEARTPLIISGPSDDNSALYQQIDKLIPRLERQKYLAEKEDEEEAPGDYYVDEKARQVYLSEEGHQKIEEWLAEEGILTEGSLYDASNIILMHHVNAALRAHALFQKNVDYIVKPNKEGKQEIVIIDEFTGRQMPGRRWSEGLHQAVEAKEKVEIQPENQTLASITFQNLFRMYEKLSGMTGTADTEAYEFQQIYNLEVIVVPTHRTMVRKDLGDQVFLTLQEKHQAIVGDIRDCIKKQCPVLVGTASIESSEVVSELLTKEGIAHQVLNARQHEKEAEVIVQAGRPGVVTIATNMAGRGTDIILGGNVEAEIKALERSGAVLTEEMVATMRAEWQKRHDAVIASGGLHIIGTERHESRRIDNQLRGRSGRQGDPGSSRFYLCLEDNLMRIFASDRMTGLMQRLGMEEGEAIEHPWVTKAIENAQRRVEGRNFEIRKHLLKYDDVANDQRKEVYKLRNELMEAESIEANINMIREEVLNGLIDRYIPPQSLDEMWQVEELTEALRVKFALDLPLQAWLDADDSLDEVGLRQKIVDGAVAEYQKKEGLVGTGVLRQFEKGVMLQVLDEHWKEHLAAMDYLKQGIFLRGYAQKQPEQEYKREAFEMFEAMLNRIKQEVTTTLCKVQVRTESDVELMERKRREEEAAALASVTYFHETIDNFADAPVSEGDAEKVEAQAGEPAAEGVKTYVRDTPKIGRNDPCYCGSGKKYKHCHGKF